MRLYTANTRQRENTVRYPHEAEIKTFADLQQAARTDHVFSKMRNNYRSAANFMETDCIVVDLDNTHSEDPNEWKTINDIVDALPAVHFYYVQSRNYLKIKIKDGKPQEPREKFHLYFPLSAPIKDREKAKRAIEAASATVDAELGTKDLLDPGAAKPDQQMYGVEDPQGGEITGELCLDEYLRQPDVKKVWKKALAEKESAATAGDQQQENGLEWIGEAEQRRSINWLLEWAQNNHVDLGKQYSIPSEPHKDGIAYPIQCPWCAEHTEYGGPKETVLIVDRGGKLNYLCRHAHCKGRGWADYKKRIEAEFDFSQDPGPVQTDKTPEEYLNETAAAAVGGFMTDKANHPEPIPTGWRALDDILGGGLFPGLYALGAQSSFGKTTFAEQLAVRLSETGHDVLFFSLEMARYELIARGISRLTACLECGKKGYTTVASAVNEKNKHPLQNARTAVDMINPQTFLHLNHDQQQLVTEAAALYRERTRHLWIIAEDEDGQHTRLNVEAINRRVEEHNAITGAYPVVFVDYLQIIAGSDQKTDKANMDDIITRLRKMSRGKYPVVVVSSFNRNNYYTEASMAAFKESGSIEYSADVLLALEPRNMNDNTTPTATAKNKDAVKDTTNMETWPVQLSVLKNRLGRRDVAVNFDYTAKFNIYEEVGRAERKRKEKDSEKKPTAYAALIKEVRDLRIDLMDMTTAVFARTNPGQLRVDPEDTDLDDDFG